MPYTWKRDLALGAVSLFLMLLAPLAANFVMPASATLDPTLNLGEARAFTPVSAPIGLQRPASLIEAQSKAAEYYYRAPIYKTPAAPGSGIGAQALTNTVSGAEKTRGSGRYASLTFTETEIETLARLVWLEARGESFEGQVAVVEVVFNRLLDDRFPDTVDGVIYQKNQFTPAHAIGDTQAGAMQYAAVQAALYGEEYILEPDVIFFSCGPYNDQIAAVIGNHYFCKG